MALTEELRIEIKAKADQAQKELTGVEKSIGGVEKALLTAFSGAAIIAGVRKFVQFMGDASDAAAVQESAVTRLSAALQITGQTTDGTLESMQEFASTMQRLTVVGDEVTLGLLQTATNMGLTADQAKVATQQAIGLSRAYGIDLNTALLGVVNTIQGQTSTLTRYIPSLKAAENETDRLRILNEEATKAWAIATAEVNTATGAQEQFRNAIGDSKELIGQTVNEALTPFRQELTEIVVKMNELQSLSVQQGRALDAFESGTANAEQAITALNVQLEDLNVQLRSARAEAALSGVFGDVETLEAQKRAILLNIENYKQAIALQQRQSAIEQSASQAEANRQASAVRGQQERAQQRIDDAQRIAEAEAFLAANAAQSDSDLAALQESNAIAVRNARAEMLNKQTEDYQDYAETMAAIQRAQLDATSGFFGALASLAEAAGEKNRGFAILAKGLASAQAAINSYLAFTQVLADPSFVGRPLARALTAGGILAAGLAQQVKILGTGIPGLAEGGIVMPSAGGSIVNVAEAGKPEAIIPLDRAGGFGSTVNVYVSGVVGDIETVAIEIERALESAHRMGKVA